jgi:magnesium transporter
MNFENMPELKWKYGYYVTWGIMISVACVLLLFFRKKKMDLTGIPSGFIPACG